MIKVLRALVATLMALAVVFGGAKVASADNTGTEGYRVQVVEQGESVGGRLDGARRAQYPTALMAISDKQGQRIALTYCIDIRTPASQNRDLGYVETDPANLPDGIALTHQIRWILANSYPVKSLADVSAADGVRVSRAEAIAATQAAIWKFANNFELDSISSGARPLYTWLVENAAKAPEVKDPGKVTLSINGDVKVTDGRLGPLVISGNTTTVELVNMVGGMLVDANGKAVDTRKIPVGQKLYVALAANADHVQFSVKGSITLTAGRAFVATRSKSQTLVTASEVVRSDSASFQWNKPAGELPKPKVSTQVSEQNVTVGATLTDTIIVEGFLTQHAGKPVTHQLTGKLYGPVAPIVHGEQKTCTGVDWTNAPVALAFQVKDVDSRKADANGKLTITGAGEYTVKTAGCYSYAETLITTSGDRTNTVEHTVGKESQTTLASECTPTPTPIVTPTPVATTTPVPDVTPTPTPEVTVTPTPVATSTPTTAVTPDKPVFPGKRPLAETGR